MQVATWSLAPASPSLAPTIIAVSHTLASQALAGDVVDVRYTVYVHVQYFVHFICLLSVRGIGTVRLSMQFRPMSPELKCVENSYASSISFM